MKNGIWKKLSLIVLAIDLSFTAIYSSANAQDNFREFDRKMVATPAELFKALSTFQPSGQRKQVDGQRLEKMEKAGRDFLSKLSPEQQEKAWEFAEKYLRKNGVDSTASQKLMRDFGLPPELQNQLSQQFRKYDNRSPNPSSRPESKADDGISELLRKARDEFQAESRKGDDSPDGVARSDQSGVPKPDSNVENDQREERASKSNSDPNEGGSKPSNSKRGQQNSDEANQNENGQKLDSDSDDPMGDPNQSTNRTDSQSGTPFGNPFDTQNPRTSPLTNRPPNVNQDSQRRLPTTNPKSTQGKTVGDSDVDLEQILERLGSLRKNNESGQRAGAGTAGDSPLGESLDWEKVIEELAEEGTKGRGFDSRSGVDGMLDALERAQAENKKGAGGKSTPNDQLDQSLLNRAKDLISGSFDPDKTDSGGWGREPLNKSASEEKLGTRFDRLLVKAAERTLTSANDDQGVTKSVGAVLGSLIERIQEQATKKKSDLASAASRNSADQELDGRGDDPAENRGNVSRGNDNSDRSNRDSNSQAASPSKPSMSDSSTGSFDPQKMLDRIPDLSTINPTQVFTILAIIGFLLFAGYLLAQALAGSESTTIKRKVIKQIRNTKIQSPKDLVETVDVFLVGKFGIKSNWWNARIAQTVLKSGSPELQTRVDDLMRDYVRARYMRDDIQIPAADQQRFKKTLEELSILEIRPEADLQVTAPSPVLGPPASMEG